MYRYYNNCVNWDRGDVDCKGGLSDLVDDSVPITRRTFLKYVDKAELRELESSMGYFRNPKQGLTMAADWSVSYFRSKHHGETVYGFCWSAIEYVFKKVAKRRLS